MQIADMLLDNAEKRGLWDTVDMILNVWFKKHPREYEEHQRFVALTRKTQKNKFGSTERKRGDLGGLRHLGEIPTDIATTLDLLCYRQIKDYGDRRFYREFFKRYPVFSVAEKI